MDTPAAGTQGARTERLAGLLREREVDLLLVSFPVNVRYLTGFSGSNGLALIGSDSGERSGIGRPRFFTDFRYATQSSEQVPSIFAREIVTSGNLLEAAGKLLDESSGSATRVGFEEEHMSVKQHTRLRELLSDRWELVACAGLVEGLREVKDRSELECIGAAAQLADEALRGVLEEGVLGRTERDVAMALELAMRRLGASAPSFPSIVAAGEHSALPHAEPRDVEIPPDTLLTIDWGASYEGYCSDCTRTFATGEISGEAREVYELVRHAQAEACAAVKAGAGGREVDGIARAIIDGAGHGEHFGHGLGHGVGMDVHEAPRLSPAVAEAPLRAGNVVTVEPGVYLPGRFGVRIEDLVIVTEDGGRSLSSLSKELLTIS